MLVYISYNKILLKSVLLDASFVVDEAYSKTRTTSSLCSFLWSVSAREGAESAIFQGVICKSAEIFVADLVPLKTKIALQHSNSALIQGPN